MFITLKIKLTSSFLGSGKEGNDGIRPIILASNNYPRFFIKRFSKLCEIYAKELNIGAYEPETIKTTNYIVVKSKPELFVKKFKDEASKSSKELIFESYKEGTIMELGCFVDETKISIDQAAKIIEYIGKFGSISQFGYKWNYGRFEILTVTKDSFSVPLTTTKRYNNE